jgi:hypothetical protein
MQKYYPIHCVFTSVLCLMVIILSPHAQAQTDFRQGYIIKNIGDTLHGQIDYRASVRMATVCVFKSATGEVTSYKPEDILGYRFKEEKYFVSKKIDDNFYFLEFLIEGKLCVYYMEDKTGNRYFMNKEDEKIIEIPYEERIKYVDYKEMKYKSTKHIGLLKYYTKDAPTLSKSIDAFGKPDHQSLIKLAKKYHETVCTDQACIVYEKKSRLTRISFEASAGSIAFGNSNNLDTEVRNKSFFQKGITALFWTSRKNERVFIRTGVLQNSDATDGHGYYIPFQIGYMAPRTFRVRPMVAISLFLPNYSAGLMIRLHKKVHLGVQTCVRFMPNSPAFFIPVFYNSTSLTGNLLIDLF